MSHALSAPYFPFAPPHIFCALFCPYFLYPAHNLISPLPWGHGLCSGVRRRQPSPSMGQLDWQWDRDQDVSSLVWLISYLIRLSKACGSRATSNYCLGAGNLINSCLWSQEETVSLNYLKAIFFLVVYWWCCKSCQDSWCDGCFSQ